MAAEKKEQCGCPDGQVRDAFGHCVMPEVSFTSFVLSLNTTALFHLGELAHPETGERILDLGLAKHSIDSLSMLQKKTKGNLSADEAELIDRVVFDLQLRFAKKAAM